MDSLKRDVSWLESFPPDIWAYLHSYLPGEQLGRLLMTGATLLRGRLKSPKVVKTINLGTDFIVFKTFPRFINEFPSLEDVSIHSRGESWSNRLGLSLSLIPSGVKKLELSGTWSEVTRKLFGETNTTFHFEDRFPKLEILDLKEVEAKLTNYSWMLHSPQTLTKLRLHDWNGTVELPSSLIHFEAEKVGLSTSVVSHLPPRLESFTADHLVGVDLLLDILPPLLRHLSMGNCKLLSIPDRLPKFLVSCQLPHINFPPNPNFMSPLPSTLTELRATPAFPCSAWPHLPPTLAKLVIKPGTVSKGNDDHHGAYCSPNDSCYPFEALPPSVTYIDLVYEDTDIYRFFCAPSMTSCGSYFPPNLVHLRMPTIQLPPEAAKLLPTSLTELEIANFDERVCEFLPRGLKSFATFQTLLSPNLIKFLPKSLQHLFLGNCFHTDRWFDRSTGMRIKSILNLAEYPIHEKCTSKSFDWSVCSPLPPKLTYLSLAHFEGIGDSFLMPQQLPNLVELRLEHCKHFTDLSIPLLSPYLTILDMSSSSEISGQSFHLLPRYLTYLNLFSSENIFDSDIQHLPRTLKEVHMSHAIHLTDACIPSLPPQLEMLNLHFNSEITCSSFRNFPYALKSSQLNWPVKLSAWGVQRGAIKSNFVRERNKHVGKANDNR